MGIRAGGSPAAASRSLGPVVAAAGGLPGASEAAGTSPAVASCSTAPIMSAAGVPLDALEPAKEVSAPACAPAVLLAEAAAETATALEAAKEAAVEAAGEPSAADLLVAMRSQMESMREQCTCPITLVSSAANGKAGGTRGVASFSDA